MKYLKAKKSYEKESVTMITKFVPSMLMAGGAFGAVNRLMTFATADLNSFGTFVSHVGIPFSIACIVMYWGYRQNHMMISILQERIKQLEEENRELKRTKQKSK